MAAQTPSHPCPDMEAPYDYAPSYAEWLSTFGLSLNGIVADLLYLDRMGLIEIENYFDGGLNLLLKDGKGRPAPENQLLLLQNFLIQKSAGAKRLRLLYTDFKPLLPNYHDAVSEGAAEKFGSVRIPMPGNSIVKNILFGLLANFIYGLLCMFMTFPFMVLALPLGALLSFILPQASELLSLAAMGVSLLMPLAGVFYLSRNKLKKSPLEAKYLTRTIVLNLAALQALNFAPFLALTILSQLAPSHLPAGPYLTFIGCLSLILIVPFTLFYYYYFGRLARQYLYWLFEGEQCAKHRRQWLEFKDYIIDYTEVEKRPPMHYELWGEFYYYALAVGAMKKPLA